jgi:type II secretory pathway pseudopilin PulG
MMNKWQRLGLLLIGFISLCANASAACEREIDTANREYLVAEKGRDGQIGDFPNFRSYLLGHFDFFRKNQNTSELRAVSESSKNYVKETDANKDLPADYKQHKRSESAAITCIVLSVLDERGSVNNLPINQAPQQLRPDQPQQSSQQNQAAQQQSQQAQQQAQQAQQQAQKTQARADQARQGQRKTHDPAAEANECIEIDKDPGVFGAFKNKCDYKVNFSTCNYKPRIKTGGFNWSADFDCEQQKFGLHTPDGGEAVTSHNRNTEMVYWFACRSPAFPVDTEFVPGSGVRGRCN